MKIENSLSIEQAIELAKNIVSINGPKDVIVSPYNDHMYLRLERGWGINCNASIDFHSWGNLHDGQEFESKMAYKINPNIEISWSSTGRTVPQGLASINCYTDMLNLLSLIEARLSEKDIYYLV